MKLQLTLQLTEDAIARIVRFAGYNPRTLRADERRKVLKDYFAELTQAGTEIDIGMVLHKIEQDVNWMCNSRAVLHADTFDYLHKTALMFERENP